MFLTSALYHAMAYETKHKYVLRILDHIFIYFAIAGSYTPIALYIIRGWQGTLILIIQWGMVLTGILYKSIAQKSIPKLSVSIYLIMGWIAILFFPVIIQNSKPSFLAFIALGGVLYSVGAWFYTKKERPYFHFIWHLFINFAAISHFIAIIFLI
jgi:hemolysin III